MPSSQKVVQHILSLHPELQMKTILLMWAWLDARNKVNTGERLPSTDEVIRKATLMRVDVVSLQKK